MKKFSSSTVAKKPISFEIDGYEFQFTAPKRAGLILGALDGNLGSTEASLDWITKGLSREHYDAPKDSEHGRFEVEGCQACVLSSMLRDEDSPFDISDLSEVFTWLIEESAARPSGKSSD